MNLEPLSHIFYLYLHDDELGTVSSSAILHSDIVKSADDTELAILCSVYLITQFQYFHIYIVNVGLIPQKITEQNGQYQIATSVSSADFTMSLCMVSE